MQFLQVTSIKVDDQSILSLQKVSIEWIKTTHNASLKILITIILFITICMHCSVPTYDIDIL